MKHLHWLLIVAAPLLLMGGYWLVVDARSGLLDWIVLAVGLALGLMGIWSAPWRRTVQAALTLAYVPLMGLTLAAGLLALECSTGTASDGNVRVSPLAVLQPGLGRALP